MSSILTRGARDCAIVHLPDLTRTRCTERTGYSSYLSRCETVLRRNRPRAALEQLGHEHNRGATHDVEDIADAHRLADIGRRPATYAGCIGRGPDIDPAARAFGSPSNVRASMFVEECT